MDLDLFHIGFDQLDFGETFYLDKFYNADVVIVDMSIPVSFITPQPLKAVRVLFSPMVSGWAGGPRDKLRQGCISETVRCRKLIHGRDIG